MLPSIENAMESIMVSFTGPKGTKDRKRAMAMSCASLTMRPEGVMEWTRAIKALIPLLSHLKINIDDSVDKSLPSCSLI